MARVRFIGPEPVTVPELGGRELSPDEITEVPDARYEGYVCQPGTWEPVEEPREPEPAAAPAAVKKTAAKPRRED
ncbi:hypothetical protein OHB04_22830 [Streptomyces sp. NBC_01775]|uniref:hypothetical protein n=1 Tax=Streptomyces sp. NBC_01775 TaxID=2975939 RepID=UPI002DD8A51E|nr:hypothetical protein [Streptomyces sp. NBC_01775]WSB78330.1 hypothetical protein OHB04_22830 [Streptomyces sp. NBC_01775]